MGLASILVALLAGVFIVAGVLTTTVPGLGFLLAFGAPALALTGIVLGGTALSRAKAAGLGGGVGMAGVVLNGLVFAPALATALTCGMCNACISVASVNSDAWDIAQMREYGWVPRDDQPQGGAAGDSLEDGPAALPPPPLPAAPQGQRPAPEDN